jgi:glycosyltransferase involved in cell wall biosynthesis
VLRILHLSTFDTNGGAARAAYRLHTGLRRLGADSAMLVEDRRSYDPDVKLFDPPADMSRRLRRRLRKERIARAFKPCEGSRPPGYALFSDDRSRHGSDLPERLPPCDVVNLHWVAGFVDYGTFFSAVARRVPIVWTLHDMNPFTGGCHCDLGCGRHRTGCGACPQIGSGVGSDLSREIWNRKKAVFAGVEEGRLRIVTPGRWLAEEAKGSPLLSRFPITVIPNGLDTDDFAPRDRRTAREVFGIPQDGRVLLCDAGSTGQRHKGFALLREALEGMADTDGLCLVSMGSVAPEIRKPRHIHLGHIDRDRWISLAYSAADLTVVPSLQDNFPNMALEAVACGVPVAGFAAGGIPDIVRPGVTGLLAQPGDAASLRRAITDLLEGDETRRRMAADCRRVAVEEYSNLRQARRYLDLYQQILDGGAGP